LLIQAGSHEILLDDAIRLAARAASDDVAVTLDVVPGVPHVFQAFAAILDEGEDALTRAGTFLGAHTGTAAAETAGQKSHSYWPAEMSGRSSRGGYRRLATKPWDAILQAWPGRPSGTAWSG